jgi:hypothetical protein
MNGQQSVFDDRDKNNHKCPSCRGVYRHQRNCVIGFEAHVISDLERSKWIKFKKNAPGTLEAVLRARNGFPVGNESTVVRSLHSIAMNRGPEMIVQNNFRPAVVWDWLYVAVVNLLFGKP